MPQNNPNENNTSIQEALEAITIPSKMAQPKQKNILSTFLLWLMVIGFYVILQMKWSILKVLLPYKYLLEKGLLVLLLVLTILLINKLISVFLLIKISDPTPRFYARKIMHFFTWVISLVIVASAYFANWTAVLASLQKLSASPDKVGFPAGNAR